jgi:hypothetical protein
MRKWDDALSHSGRGKSRKGQKKEIDVDGLVLVEAESGMGDSIFT